MPYDTKNTGVLFVKKERKSEKQPNFQGKININGKDFDLAGWTKVSKTGDKFISLKVEEPRDYKSSEPQQKAVDYGDPLPF